MSATVAAGGARPLPTPSPERLRARKKATWRRRRLVLLLMSPFILGGAIFFVFPLIITGLLSFTHYDLLSDAALGRLCELQLPVRDRQADLARGHQHASG